jgi:Cof subfamily protein (haloacid dehalogenase superfamily)
MPIQLVAIDLDDTLLRKDLTISPANHAAIQSIRQRGIRVVLASGRTMYSMKPYAAALGLTGPGEYIICSNGAEIIETAHERIIYERDIDGGLCLDIAQAVKSHGFSYQFYEEGRIRASTGNNWTSEDTRLTGQKLELIAPEDEKTLLARGLVKFVIPGEPERISELYKTMQTFLHGRAEVMISKPYFLEILPQGANKGEALTHLAGLLGIDMEDVLAMGDSMNDAAMLRMAGRGCAPANATQAARDAADYICDFTHEEDAVAHIIDRFIGPNARPDQLED